MTVMASLVDAVEMVGVAIVILMVGSTDSEVVGTAEVLLMVITIVVLEVTVVVSVIDSIKVAESVIVLSMVGTTEILGVTVVLAESLSSEGTAASI